jgi:hypothetical protein
MKKTGIYMSLSAMLVLLSSPVWAAPTALSDSDMDGVYAQGITISNSYNDNDTFTNTTTQTSSNTLTGTQTNTPDNDARAAALAGGGDATGSADSGNANANGGDGGNGGDGLLGGGGTGGAGGNGLAGNLVPGGNAFGGPGLAGAGAGVLNPNTNVDNDMPISANVAATLQTSLGLNVQVIADINAADNGSVAIDDINRSAVANLSSIANRNVRNSNLQAAVNGDNVFNNLQNQISIANSPEFFGLDVPVINTVIGNTAAPTAVALGTARSGPAFAGAANVSNAVNIPVATSAATNFGLAGAGAGAGAFGPGGTAIQVPIADPDNLGLAGAGGNDGGTPIAANGALGLTGAGSTAVNPAGNAGSLAGATGGDNNSIGGDALAAALAGAGGDNDALSAALAAQRIGQGATAGNANGGQSDASNDQTNGAAAAAIADTSGHALAAAGAKAYNDQNAESDKATAEGKNDVKQENAVNAQSTATNLTAADASGTVAIVKVDQNNLVKSLQVSGANDNKGNIFLSIQSSVQQQVNSVSSGGYASPIVQGNAVAVNTLFN